MNTSKPIQTYPATTWDKIFGNTTYRKLYHLAGGSLIIAGYLLLDRAWFIVFCILYILGFYFFCRRITFAVIGLLILVILSNQTFVTLSAAVVWLVGDGLAGLIGGTYGKRRWPWHSSKTILGSASFFAGSFLAVLVVLRCTIKAPMDILLLLSILTSLGACVVEMLPITLIKDRKADDNLLIILSSAVLIFLFSTALGVRVGY